MFVTLLALAAAATAPIQGRWFTPEDKAVVEIAPCGEAYCGVIVSTRMTAEGRSPQDIHNPDPNLRTRPLAGVQILLGLTPKDTGGLDGRIYNPEDGRTYTARVQLRDDGQLAVKGCVGVLCRTQLWRPAE